MDKRLEILS